MLDLMIELVKHNIDFNTRSVNDFTLVYIQGYKDENGYKPEIRVTLHDDGYYVKNCDVISEGCTIDDILEMAGELQYFDK